MLHILCYLIYQKLISTLEKRINLDQIYNYFLHQMDLEWLLPEQIEQILKLCELSSMEDLGVAANILQTNHWDLQKALHDVIGQNDNLEKKQQQKIKDLEHGYQMEREQEHSNHFAHSHDEYDQGEEYYQNITKDIQFHDHIDEGFNQIKETKQNIHDYVKVEQNLEYAAMEKQYFNAKEINKAKKIEEEQRDQQILKLKQEFQKEEFINESEKISIKFRLSTNGATAMRSFSKYDLTQKLFDFVSGTQRDHFEQKHSEFDLIQGFSNLSLKDQKQKKIMQIFQDSDMELLIVKEI